ncbi:brachyurin-like [Photinus pyralis]|uniref:brachyurin-like n=1 Tax=Photinus pyralis TaxID=7054 RepID=UPI0012673E36|nr:brachyurin-like [Photinus pyralis]
MKTFITFSILLLAFAQAKFIHFDPPTKIVGGDEAALHGFPYQVAIFIQVPQGTGFCGGSLISDKHILTAAHCVSSASSALVMVGAHNIKAEESNRQEFNTTSFAVHEQWFPLFILNDIAIIKINDAIQVDGVTVKILALAPATEDAVLTGLQATVSGWGKDSDSAQGVSSVLRYVNSTIIENDICKIFYFGNIRDEHICMNGWEGKSSCQGDSGGPLVMTRDGELTQYGVVSFGIIFGCEKGWPSVYTSVPKYRSWIDGKLASF